MEVPHPVRDRVGMTAVLLVDAGRSPGHTEERALRAGPHQAAVRPRREDCRRVQQEEIFLHVPMLRVVSPVDSDRFVPVVYEGALHPAAEDFCGVK